MRFFRTPKKPTLYIVVQEHIDNHGGGLGLSFAHSMVSARVPLYRQYASDVRKLLKSVKPKECVFYMENVATTKKGVPISQDKLKDILIHHAKELGENDLVSTLVKSMLEDGASASGVENEKLLSQPNFAGGSPENKKLRDEFIAEYIRTSHPRDKTAILIIGAGHQDIETRFSESEFTVISTRDMFMTRMEGNLLTRLLER